MDLADVEARSWAGLGLEKEKMQKGCKLQRLPLLPPGYPIVPLLAMALCVSIAAVCKICGCTSPCGLRQLAGHGSGFQVKYDAAIATTTLQTTHAFTMQSLHAFQHNERHWQALIGDSEDLVRL